MTQAKVTILIPNYKTRDLTKLCLRLIRKHTDCRQIKVIVIDNDSADDGAGLFVTYETIGYGLTSGNAAELEK